MNDQDQKELAFEELKSVLRKGATQIKSEFGAPFFEVTAADGDAIIILSEACSERLSDRFREVLSELKDVLQKI